MLQRKQRIPKYIIFYHIRLVYMILLQQKFPTFPTFFSYSLSKSKIRSRSYNDIYNSSQNVCESTEQHLMSTGNSRILSQKIKSPKFSIKSLLNRSMQYHHKTGYIDALNQNLLLANLTNDFMDYDTDIFK